MRAICPNCGGKIHTQAKGLGHLSWANTWFTARTGTECQHCGVALTGKVTADGRAELVGAQRTTLAGFVKTVPTSPAPPARTEPAPSEGWWPDPTGRYDRRYFDGIAWTWRVREDDGNVVVDPQGSLR